MDRYTNISKEILRFCREETVLSYYELEDYAEKNNPEWLEALSSQKTRAMISTYIRSQRRIAKENGIKVPTLYESVKKITDTE